MAKWSACAAAVISSGLVRRALPVEPVLLSSAQINSILSATAQAGCPPGANLMSLQTSNGMGFTISKRSSLITANSRNEWWKHIRDVDRTVGCDRRCHSPDFASARCPSWQDDLNAKTVSRQRSGQVQATD